MTRAWTPRTLEEALALRTAHPRAIPVAGGTGLMVEVNRGRLEPEALLDLSRVEELLVWERDADRIRVGAGVTFARLAGELDDQIALVEAAATVGSPQIRNRGTLGGNLATASPAGDALAALAAYEADVVVASTAGIRRVPWHAFLLGPKRTVLADDELVVAAEWTPAEGPGTFAKLGPRGAMVIAVASVCLQLDEPSHRARIALGSVGPTVLRAWAAEELLAGLDWDAVDGHALERTGELAAAETRPIDDLRGSAAYRRHAVSVLVRRALSWTLRDRGRAAA